VQQAEGGEQGDPLMPALYSLAQHNALAEVHATLQDGENIFAYLDDDVYIVSHPARTCQLYADINAALWDHARVQLNPIKTKIWNSAGEEPAGLRNLQPPNAPATTIWVGDWALPPEQQGLQVLGAPLGTAEYIQAALDQTLTKQRALLERIPTVPHLQSAWLLLLYCGSARYSHQLRVVDPAATIHYAAGYDASVDQCLTQLLHSADDPLPPLALAHARLPLRLGGLGATAHAEPGNTARGWQRLASRPGDERAQGMLLSALSPASQALLHSQAGPFAGLPTSFDLRLPDDHFRVALLACPYPSFHAAAIVAGTSIPSATTGLPAQPQAISPPEGLASKSPLPEFAARLAADVARNVALADMNLDEPVADGRRLEIVANGLGVYHGQQLAIDTTCISPITRAGEPHPGADTTPGRAADNALQRKRRRYPELTRARRCRLIVFAIEVGGRWGSEALQVTRALAHARAAEAPPWLRAAAANAWLTRWSATIAVAAQRALATTLLELPAHGASIGGDMPELPELLADDRWQTPAGPSRMPAA